MEGYFHGLWYICSLSWHITFLLDANKSRKGVVSQPSGATHSNAENANRQFASLIMYYLGYSNFGTMLYTLLTGAVQIIFIWVGIILCYLWPNCRYAITIGLRIIPLTGTILLFVLYLSASWVMICSIMISM
jgi:hypothetical protein